MWLVSCAYVYRQLNSGTTSTGSSDSESDLPYPAPLDRNDFLHPDFSAASYLSTLQNRHQNLEDLQSELRSRGALLSKELLDLVNSNYQDFIDLGLGLSGSEGKVEEVRLDVMGFRREVENMKSRISKEESQIDGLIQERIQIQRDISIGRDMLYLDSRIRELERQLIISPSKETKINRGCEQSYNESLDFSSDDDKDGMPALSQARLRRLVQKYLHLKQVVRHNGVDHPFVVAQNARISKITEALQLDLSVALKRLKSEASPDADKLLQIIGLFRDMDKAAEALKILKLRPR